MAKVEDRMCDFCGNLFTPKDGEWHCSTKCESRLAKMHSPFNERIYCSETDKTYICPKGSRRDVDFLKGMNIKSDSLIELRQISNWNR